MCEITDRYWKEIKESASSRNISFFLTRDYCWRLFLNQKRSCALSKEAINMSCYGYRGTASLDRIDSDLPYTEENVQWVHSTIQMMKGRMNMSYFRDMCCKVAKRSDPGRSAL